MILSTFSCELAFIYLLWNNVYSLYILGKSIKGDLDDASRDNAVILGQLWLHTVVVRCDVSADLSGSLWHQMAQVLDFSTNDSFSTNASGYCG